MEYGHLTHAQKKTYNAAIIATHQRRIEVRILTLDGHPVWSLTPLITSGQITTDVTQTPMQVATLTFVDRARALVFEPQDTGSPTMHRQFMLQIVDSRLVPGLGWIDCNVFTGPIWDFERTGAEVNLTAHSVDRLASGTIRRAKVWRRKTRKTTVIRELLAEAGATRMRIPDLRYTTSVHVHVRHTHPAKKGQKSHTTRKVTGFTTTQQSTYWDKATGLAESMDRLLFPTTDGTFELRSHPERPIYHFNRALLGDVDLHRPGSDGPNTFQVIGSRPKGSKRRVDSGLVGFPARHPLSASQLAWHGKPFQVLEQIHNPHCKTKAECRRIAKRKRDRAARMVAEVSFDALPIPWLRPWDMVTSQAGWGVPSVRIKQMTYPLTPDASPMTIGSVRRAVPRRRSA
jgi:hypothetical protein